MSEVPNTGVQSPLSRYRLYIVFAAIGAACILATLVMMGILTEEQINTWVALTISLVGLILTTAGNLLARVNVPRNEDGSIPAKDEPVE